MNTDSVSSTDLTKRVQHFHRQGRSKVNFRVNLNIDANLKLFVFILTSLV